RRSRRADGSAGRARERRRFVPRGSGSRARRFRVHLSSVAVSSRAYRRRGRAESSAESRAWEEQGAMSLFGMQLVGPAVAGGFIGTLVLTTIIRAAAEMGLTRMDLPFLLGTMLTENRRQAKAIGYVLHVLL